jgi:hypothetical protein
VPLVALSYIPEILIKQSLQKFGEISRAHEVKDPRIYRQSGQEGGKVVTSIHWAPLPPGDMLGTHFCWRLSRFHWESSARFPACSAVSQPTSPKLAFNLLQSVSHTEKPVCTSLCPMHDTWSTELQYLSTLTIFGEDCRPWSFSRGHFIQSSVNFQLLVPNILLRILLWNNFDLCSSLMGRDNTAGIETSYGLDGPGSNPGGGEIFRTHPDRQWGLPSLLYNGYRVFLGGKAAGVWCWPPTPSKCRGHERVGLYLYSPSGPSWPVIGRTFP